MDDKQTPSTFSGVTKIFGILIIVLSLVFIYVAYVMQEQKQNEANQEIVVEPSAVMEQQEVQTVGAPAGAPVKDDKFNF